MDEFMRSYGLWIALAAVFLAMHWFGGCGASHRHGSDAKPGEKTEPEASGEARRPARSARGGGCH
ncbi:MAG: hypothetical protein HYR51_04990 [Candidatus Rokubacteria bacterium]|nr:hypothetical protein [Candidatus Rokubacteria bacterium]